MKINSELDKPVPFSELTTDPTERMPTCTTNYEILKSKEKQMY
jgi:hypothetical protein